MEYLEEYDDQCQALVQNIEKWFKDARNSQIADADKQQIMQSIRGKMEDLKDTLTYFKSDLYLVPRAKEGEFRKKYDIYSEKMDKYEVAAKKLEMVLCGDIAGLRDVKRQEEQDKLMAGSGLNQQTQLLAKKGFKVQDDSGDALKRIKKTVLETQEVQAGIQNELQVQNDRLLKFNDNYGRIESTLTRTKGKIAYFKKSFMRDKIAVSLVCLIFIAAAGAIAILVMPSA